MPGHDTSTYIEASVEIPLNLSDAVSNFIIDNISSGLLIEGEEKSEFITIKFYLPSEDDKNFRQMLDYYFNSLLEMDNALEYIPDIKERIVENVEWEDAYKESIKAIIVSEDVVVRPPWEEKPAEAQFDIIIEPKMAFGTGTHETTRSCLEIIRKTFKKNMTFLDMGCGSGILSILADQMGAKYIKAIDYDQISVENAEENFDLNEVTTDFEVHYGSIELCDNDEPFDFVCANIIKSAILSMLDKLDRLTKQGGYLVLSGLLDDDVEEVKEHLIKIGLSDYTILADNEWRSFIIHKRR